jgi:hypothetical protein
MYLLLPNKAHVSIWRHEGLPLWFELQFIITILKKKLNGFALRWHLGFDRFNFPNC